MPNPSQSTDVPRLIEQHLQSWGLKRFQQETDYYQWQQQALSASDLSSLNHLVQHRQHPDDPSVDIQFYDLAATSTILPVLYSQRYDFYCLIGAAIADRLSARKCVLDFGCGVGILSTFWATLFPEVSFVGIDRSAKSIAVATEYAAQHRLGNIQFVQTHIPRDKIAGSFDCIISTQVLFQAEVDPGLCSADWQTFERSQDVSLQQQAEVRTGVGIRLDALSQALTKNGTLLLYEKTRHLGRRVLLQRALACRGFQNIKEPMTLTYDSIDEHVEDGPFYEVVRNSREQGFGWDEQAAWSAGQSLYAYSGVAASQICAAFDLPVVSDTTFVFSGTKGRRCHVQFGTWSDALAFGVLSTPHGFYGLIMASVQDEAMLVQLLTRFETLSAEEIDESIPRIWSGNNRTENTEPDPCYENHTSAAQTIWQALPDRAIREEHTFREPDGRAMHIELGVTGPFMYVYWANTYDQRQLVMAEVSQAEWLVGYYHESLAEMQPPSPS